MRKILLFFVFGCVCMLFAQQEEITIKATGEFAKELKELMEKYQTNDVNGTIEIINENKSASADTRESAENEEPLEAGEAGNEIVLIDDVSHINATAQSNEKEQKGFGITDMLFGKKEINGNLTQGENLYKKSCASCHGEKAEKSSYLSARDLITLNKEEIADQLKNYKRDSGYGGTSGLIMRVRAMMLSESQINDIASYIESLK
ncbi:MAG: c-type cytochrome [Campylobacteraceae bacterium]|jgi:cytochrome c553|nr:c-type cytochrome [Campylobacteraceae bacterium]